jgi:hypothetical protein
MYQLNPNAKNILNHIGAEKTPVYFVDDILNDLSYFLSKAHDIVEFEGAGEKGYPGPRSPLDVDYTQTILYAIENKLRQIYQVPGSLRLKVHASYYSMVAKPASLLSTFQRIPHIDSANPYYFAIMHYINPGDFGGTGLYRHNPTNFENITLARLHDFEGSVQSYLNANGLPETRYFTESDAHFSLIGLIPYKSNRLVVYPGSQLHSGYIKSANDIGTDLLQGRLTANIFVEFVS